MNMISFLNTSDRTAWTQTGPEKPFGFSGPVPCLCNTNIPAIDYFLISPPQKEPAAFLFCFFVSGTFQVKALYSRKRKGKH